MKKLKKGLIIWTSILLLFLTGIIVGVNYLKKALGELSYVAYYSLTSYLEADSNQAVRDLKETLGGTALGVCHPKNDAYNVSLLKDAYIGWIRIDIGSAPYQVDSEGNPVLDGEGNPIETEGYINFKNRCQIFQDQGIKVMAVTPYPDGMLDLIGEEDMFTYGADNYSDNFINMIQDFALYYAEDLNGYVDAFQISNELTVPKWQGELSTEQVSDYIGLQMVAMHDTCEENGIPIGYNMAAYSLYNFPESMQRYADYFDYVGLDLYLGCFESTYKSLFIYDLLLRYLYNYTNKPIMLNEFGYISAGTQMSEEEKSAYLYNTFCEEFSSEDKIKANISGFLDKWEEVVGEESSLIREARRQLEVNGTQAAIDYVFADDQIAHLYKSLPDGYQLKDYEHTQEGQAEFFTDLIQRIYKMDFVCGMFIYCYSDSTVCYQCGQENCPVETGWGLVSVDDDADVMNSETVHLKASYYAVQAQFKKIIEREAGRYN